MQKKIKNYLKEFEALKNQEEQNTIQWNLLLAEKDAQIITLCEKISSLKSTVSSNELDMLSCNEDGLVHLNKDA